MDPGWGVVLGEGLCQTTESRCVQPCHQIHQLDQEAAEQWSTLRPLPLLLASLPVLAAVVLDGPVTFLPFLSLLCLL
jgi:hypothetical protein